MKEELLTFKEVSVLLNVSLSTVYSLVYQKRIPHLRLGNRFVRFDKETVLDWLEKTRVNPEINDEANHG